MVKESIIREPYMERLAYIMYYDLEMGISKNIGLFLEQKNLQGEHQYLFRIFWGKLSPEEKKQIIIPGLFLGEYDGWDCIYTDREPFFMSRCIVPQKRSDFDEYQRLFEMLEKDDFEFFLRQRGISKHSWNCYVGRHSEDLCDISRFWKDLDYMNKMCPNMNKLYENEWHLTKSAIF